MTKETKIKVGDSVYYLKARPLSRSPQPIENVIVELRVVKVGRKYFYTMPLAPESSWKSTTQWSLQTLWEVRDCGRRLHCFRTRQDLQDNLDSDRIYTLLREGFSRYSSTGNLSIDQLRRIEAITKE